MKKLLAVTFCLLGLSGCGRRDCGPCVEPCPQEQIYCPECREYHEPEAPMPMRREMRRQPMRGQPMYTDESMMGVDSMAMEPSTMRTEKAARQQQVESAKGKAQAQAQAVKETQPKMNGVVK